MARMGQRRTKGEARCTLAAFAARCAAATAAVEADAAAAAAQAAPAPAAAAEAGNDPWHNGIYVDWAVEHAAAWEATTRYWDWVAVRGIKKRDRRGRLWFKVDWDDRDGRGESWGETGPHGQHGCGVGLAGCAHSPYTRDSELQLEQMEETDRYTVEEDSLRVVVGFSSCTRPTYSRIQFSPYKTCCHTIHRLTLYC